MDRRAGDVFSHAYISAFARLMVISIDPFRVSRRPAEHYFRICCSACSMSRLVCLTQSP